MFSALERRNLAFKSPPEFGWDRMRGGESLVLRPQTGAFRQRRPALDDLLQTDALGQAEANQQRRL